MKPLDFEGSFLFAEEAFRVRPLQHGDIETLRVWKNENRQFFHHKEIITPEQQERWFSGFLPDKTKQLFVCEFNQELLACVGFKIKKPGRVELFNLICGSPRLSGRGFVKSFFDYVKQQLIQKGFSEIELEVLKSNTRAVQWYLRQGFQQVGEEETFFHLLLRGQ